jgi:hypothetical protein
MEILAPWCASSDRNISELARYTVAKMLPYVRERDDLWIAFAQDVFGLPGHFLRDQIAHGDDSVLLVILICAARQVISAEPWKWEMLSSISKFDILNTLPELQIHFCSLWNEIVKEANDRGHHRDHLDVLRGIRHLYIALHQGTASAPTVFDGSTPSDDFILYSLSSYPFCSIPTHRLDPAVSPLPGLDGPHNPSPLPPPLESQPTPVGNTVLQQAKETIDIGGRRSSAHDPPLRSQESHSPPGPNTVPGHIISEANPAVLPPSHGSIETVTLDINRLVIAEVAHFSHQSSPSTTAALTTHIVHFRDPASDEPVDEMGRPSPTAAATLDIGTLPYSDADPVVVTPSTVPCAQGDFSTVPFIDYPSAYLFSSPRRRYRAAGYGRTTICISHRPNLVHGKPNFSIHP